MPEQILRTSILNPRPNGTVDFLRDGVIHADANGRIAFIGEFRDLAACLGPNAPVAKLSGILLPPFFDNHIHIPQHPIRGGFMKDVPANPPEGRLLAGLNKNVFPTEAKCTDHDYTERVIRQFLADTLSKGVVGGAAYMTIHAQATELALQILPPTWRVGLVMMNMNCPEYLRTDEANLERDLRRLATRFDERFIVTDRFAVSVSSPLRRLASEFAAGHGLRMQTHLNEQRAEKRLVEQTLYPDASSYTDVYRRDGLLDEDAILAHCIHMRDDELAMVRDAGAVIAHCPTSNTLLGSGIMNLGKVIARGIDYAICTDVGASSTTSILQEMSQYLKVHHGRSNHATPAEALYRSTLAPARMLGLSDIGTFEVGKPLSFIEVACDPAALKSDDVNDVILAALLDTSADDLDRIVNAHECKTSLAALESKGLDIGPELGCLEAEIARTQAKLENKVIRVVIDGRTVWARI